MVMERCDSNLKQIIDKTKLSEDQIKTILYQLGQYHGHTDPCAL